MAKRFQFRRRVRGQHAGGRQRLPAGRPRALAALRPQDSGATIELSKSDKLFTLHAPADFVARQVIDILSSKLIKRGVDLKAVS